MLSKVTNNVNGFNKNFNKEYFKAVNMMPGKGSKC